MLQVLFAKLRALADRRLPAHLRDARRGEDLAYHYLSKQGYRIVARNYRSRSGKGEIDLVGWDAEQLAFIEVKTRASEEFGRPERAVDKAKQRHLVRSADDYLRRSNVAPELVRFDVVSILLQGEQPQVELHKDAFSRRSAFSRGQG